MIVPVQKSSISNGVIYQVFTGRWESANIKDHKEKVFATLSSLSFENLIKIGIDTIYLMGVFNNKGPIIVESEEGIDLQKKSHRYPSPFAISDHTSTNSDLGSINDLKKLISTLQKKGFRVILDFVPNHTSTVHPWVETHPEYYVVGGSFVKEFSGDVYKLNYQNPSLKDEMIKVLKIIQKWGADGVRCDMAHLVPLDFWKHAISTIKSINNEFTFIAEAYSGSSFDYQVISDHIEVGFDGVYHHALYDNLKKVYLENQPKSFIKDHISYINSRSDLNTKLINYIENHDDHSPVTNKDDLSDALNLLYSCKGSTLLYNGTLNLFNRRIAHHFIDILPDEYNEIFNSPKIKSAEFKNVIALDIGASKIESAIVNEKYQLDNINKQPTIKTNFQDFVKQIITTINKLHQDQRNVHSISIALPGIIDFSGNIKFAGGNLPFLSNKNLKTELEKHFQVPIYIENDSNSFALGEAIMGAGRNFNIVFGITWGTGIGSGIVFNKKLFKGAGAAGEIGHIPITSANQSIKCGCGKSNCLEKYASGSAIQNQYKEMGGKISDATVEDIVNSKEPIATALIDQAVQYLAEGITAVINLINPEIIIIGGGLSHIKNDVFTKLEKTIKKYDIDSIHKTVIVKKELKNAALIGSAIIARKEYET